MADVLSAKIQVTAPGVQQAFEGVAKGAISTEKALQKLPTASSQATASLVNLGRVVQDAPFGFIGIANNLNPLIEGFGRLKTSTGGVGGAIKALGSSLIGAGGLGLAVSVVSSALVLFGDRLFGAGKAAKATDESITNLAKKFAEQITTLTTLVGIITNVNSAYKEKEQALKALNQEYGTYLKDLGIEQVTANNVADAYERIVDAMLRQAVVKGVQEQITQAIEATAKELVKLQVAQETARINSEARAKAQTEGVKKDKEEAQSKKFLEGQLQSFNRGARDGVIAQQEFNQEQTRTIAATDLTAERIELLKNQLKQSLAPLLNLTTNFEDLGIKLDKNKEKVKKTVEEYDALKAIFRDLLSIREIFGPQINKELQKLAETSKKIFGSRFAIQIDLEPDKSKNISASLDREIKRLTERNPVIEIQIKRKKEGEKAFEQLKKEVENTADVVGNILGPAFDSVFDAIREGGNVLKAFVAGIGQAVLQLVQRLISAAALAAVIAALTGGKGGFSFLTLFKSFAGFRAGGGPVQAGRSYIVGENGPELFRPNTGGSIVSNNNLMTGGKVAGGMSFEVVGTNVIRGQDIVTIFHAVNRSQGRLT